MIYMKSFSNYKAFQKPFFQGFVDNKMKANPDKCLFICSFNLKKEHTSFSYKQSIFDPRPENCLSFSKKLPKKIV